MFRSALLSVAVFGCVSSLALAEGQTQAVTLSECLAEGLKNNPASVIADLSVRSARSNFVGLRAPVNPTIGFSGLNNTVALPDFTNSANYAVYFTLETSGRQGIRSALAEAQLSQSASDARTAKFGLAQQIANAYVGLQVAQLNLQSETVALANSAKLRDLTADQVRLGAAPQTNAMRAEVAYTEEQVNMEQAQAAVKSARANLAGALGRKNPDELEAVDPLSDLVEIPDENAALADAESKRSEVASAQANARASRATVAFEQSQYFPDLILGTDLQSRQLFLGFTLPLFDFGSIRGTVSKAKTDALSASEQVRQMRLQVDSDVHLAVIALQSAQQTVDSYKSGVLPQADSLRTKVEQGYSLGGNTILDVIDAQETARTVRNSYDNALGNLRLAQIQLLHALGREII